MLNEHVLWFQVTVSDPHGMEVFESADDLGQVESDHGEGEDSVGLVVAENVEVAGGGGVDQRAEDVLGISE